MKNLVGWPLRFGSFMAPFHAPRQDAVRSYAEDLELIVRLDELGYDEVWVGEHHSGGWEPVPFPEMFIAVAAERTKSIRLGTGVVSLSYHHPFMAAERMVFLDLLTRGRVMFGVGPGALSTDVEMLGISMDSTRGRMDEALGVIMKLLAAEAPVNHVADWFELHDAVIQLPSYQKPHLPVAVASTISPAGAYSAGRHGVGLLSLGSYMPSARLQLANHWEIAEKTAAENGKIVDRRQWTLVTPMHIAPTREQALAEAEAGGDAWLRGYYNDTSGYPPMFPDDTGKSSYRRMAEERAAFVGTPDDVADGIAWLWELTGGFGSMLILENCAAPPRARTQSYELFAREVIPRFTGSTSTLNEAQRRSHERSESGYVKKVNAQTKAHTDYFGTDGEAKDAGT
ncbi:MAG: LLM class flavin-dependent oxidoreductase [Actinobacteria bacterium]|nr:MAG: LLM class flavin-dependent oxidoreductase [Actinomycetota bacterium]